MTDYVKLAKALGELIPYARPSNSMPVPIYYSAEALWMLHDALLKMADDDANRDS